MVIISFMVNRQLTSCAVRGVRLFLFFLLLVGCGHETNFIDEDTQDRPPSSNQNQNPNPNLNPNSNQTGTAVSFVTFGDWGADRDEPREVAGAISDYCTANPCDFIVTLGDNIYDNGVESIEDPLWQERFHDVYDFLGLVFYASLGNHDNNGNIQAQIDYTDVVDNWVMLDEHYTFSKPDAVRPPLADFFIINSDWPNFDGVAQVWLDGAIADSDATWKFLAMHHPIYNAGRGHGDGDDGYIEDLVPIICDRIDLVLSAHDHDFNYVRSDEDGCLIDQFVIGTGGQSLHDVNLSDPRLIAGGSFYGFGWFQVTPKSILFRMIDTLGETFYEAIFEKD